MKDILLKINELAKTYADYTAGNLSKLVRIKSLSLGEKAVAAELKRQMEEAGFDEVRLDGLGNVIGRIGHGSKVLCFDGHIDTVDVGNIANWEFDPFSGEIRDGFVHGRARLTRRETCILCYCRPDPERTCL